MERNEQTEKCVQSLRHRTRCSDCKQAVAILLRACYGTVDLSWNSGWPCRAGDIEEAGTRTILTGIHGLLVAHRGHDYFVRRRRLPRCDYFVRGIPNFIVEFDEAQHFTAPRAIALSNIPATHELAFDRNRWLALCRTIDAHDNDPFYRDEQRAWYDVLRDMLPPIYGLGPTSRLLDSEVAYCALDPESAVDRAAFVALLNRPAEIGI